jgi:DNA-binding MarR family transcriptional regulator
MRVLVFVMRRGRVTGTDILNGLDLTRPTTSRIVAALSDEAIGRRQDEPLNFIRIVPDTSDRRIKHIELTERGQALAAKMLGFFGTLDSIEGVKANGQDLADAMPDSLLNNT